MDINEWIQTLNIHPGSVVSVVGCGGKTTLVKTFARAMADHYRICVAATTKMRRPRVNQCDDLFVRYIHECDNGQLNPGIYYFADEIVFEDKLHEFGAYMVAQAKAYTDILLIEADGSKEKPLKGWAKKEPVIIEDTTMTIGILTLKELGKTAGERNVHRMQFFEEQTGIREGDLISEDVLCRMINHPEAMFKYSRNRKILLINQVDTDEEAVEAHRFLTDHELIADEIYYGSLKNGSIERFR